MTADEIREKIQVLIDHFDKVAERDGDTRAAYAAGALAELLREVAT
jgi:hypothetical protein